MSLDERNQRRQRLDVIGGALYFGSYSFFTGFLIALFWIAFEGGQGFWWLALFAPAIMFVLELAGRMWAVPWNSTSDWSWLRSLSVAWLTMPLGMWLAATVLR